MTVKVISLPYIFQVLYVLCFSMPRYQVSVYRTIGPLVLYKYRFEGVIFILRNFPDGSTKPCYNKLVYVWSLASQLFIVF